MPGNAEIYAGLLAEWGYERVQDPVITLTLEHLFYGSNGPPIYVFGDERGNERTDFVFEPEGRTSWTKTAECRKLGLPFACQDGTVEAYEAGWPVYRITKENHERRL